MSMLHIAIYEGRVGGRGFGLEVESASVKETCSHPFRPRGLTGPMLPASFLPFSLPLLFYLSLYGSCGCYGSVKHLFDGSNFLKVLPLDVADS